MLFRSGRLSPSSFEAVSAAGRLDGRVTVVVPGGTDTETAAVALARGARQIVLTAEVEEALTRMAPYLCNRRAARAQEAIEGIRAWRRSKQS